jgi:Family of unknown function (DUF5678)
LSNIATFKNCTKKYLVPIFTIYAMENLDDFAKSDLGMLERLAKNFEWFHSHHGILKEEYESQYIAIKDRKLLDNDNDLERLVKRLDFKNYKSLSIEFVYN